MKCFKLFWNLGQVGSFNINKNPNGTICQLKGLSLRHHMEMNSNSCYTFAISVCTNHITRAQVTAKEHLFCESHTCLKNSPLHRKISWARRRERKHIQNYLWSQWNLSIQTWFRSISGLLADVKLPAVSVASDTSSLCITSKWSANLLQQKLSYSQMFLPLLLLSWVLERPFYYEFFNHHQTLPWKKYCSTLGTPSCLYELMQGNSYTHSPLIFPLLQSSWKLTLSY